LNAIMQANRAKMVWLERQWTSGVWLNPYSVVHCSTKPLRLA